MTFCHFPFFHCNFWRKLVFSPENSAKLCDTPLKFKDQKPRTMEIPHKFLLNNPGNSTAFLIDSWKFYRLFLQYPGKLHVPKPLFE